MFVSYAKRVRLTFKGVQYLNLFYTNFYGALKYKTQFIFSMVFFMSFECCDGTAKYLKLKKKTVIKSYLQLLKTNRNMFVGQIMLFFKGHTRFKLSRHKRCLKVFECASTSLSKDICVCFSQQ